MIIIPAQKDVPLGRDQKLVIVPLSDIHHNAKGFDREKWLEVINWIVASDKRPDRKILVLLIGDYLDTFSASERRALGAAQLHETSRHRIERMLLDDLGAMAKDLEPIKHLIHAVVSGNHTALIQVMDDDPSLVGKTTDQILAERLGVPFLGVSGALILSIYDRDRGPKTAGAAFPFKIFMHHGFGAASTKSASIMQMMKLVERFVGFDLFIMGHNHVPIATTAQKIGIKRNTRTGLWSMTQETQAFVRAASFLKGYLENEVVIPGYKGSYIEEKAYVPAGLGVVTCNVRLRKDKRSRVAGLTVHVQE